jgi:hypothetical protein
MSFFFQKQRTGAQNRSYLRGWYQWEAGGYTKRVKEGEYGENIMYTYVNGKMRPVEIISGIREEGIKENCGGGEFTPNCKNSC